MGKNELVCWPSLVAVINKDAIATTQARDGFKVNYNLELEGKQMWRSALKFI